MGSRRSIRALPHEPSAHEVPTGGALELPKLALSAESTMGGGGGGDAGLLREVIPLLVQSAPPSFSKSTCNHFSTHTYALIQSYSLSSMVQSTSRCQGYSPTVEWESLRARLFPHPYFSQIRFPSSLPSGKGSALALGKVLPRELFRDHT